MRKFILIAAMVLASASAQAGQSRSLILAANDEQPSTEQPAIPAAPQTTPAPAAAPQTTTTTTDTPKYVERPAAVAPAATTPATTPTTETPKTTKTTDAKADKARKRRDTEARVIYELHRHGIYW
jgi:hypothetical protein